jgi:hypothetical protein
VNSPDVGGAVGGPGSSMLGLEICKSVGELALPSPCV